MPNYHRYGGGWSGLVGELIDLPEGFVTLKKNYTQMQEHLEQVPALIFLECYSSVESPLALITGRPITYIMQIPTHPGFHRGMWGFVLPVLSPVGGEL